MSSIPPPRRRIIASADGSLPTADPQSSPSSPTTGAPPPPWARPAPAAAAPAPRLDVEGLRHRAAQNQANLVKRLGAALTRAAALRTGIENLNATTAQEGAAHAAQATAAAENAYAAGRSMLAQQRLHRADDLERQAGTLLDALAPGAASAAWPELPSTDHGLAGAQRIGTTPGGQPVVHPLTVGSGWALSGDPRATAGLLVSTLTRLVAQSPVSNLRIHTFDPRSSGQTAGLVGLRTLNPSAFPLPLATAGTFLGPVEAALDAAPHNAEIVSGAGARDFADMWRSGHRSDGTLSVLVVLDYPFGVTPELNAGLARLARLGPSSATLLLVQHDPRTAPADRVDPAELLTHLPTLTVTPERVTSQLTGDLHVAPDAPPTPDEIAGVLATARARSENETGRTVTLDSLLEDDLRQLWTRSSRDAVDMVLGVAGNDVLPVAFRTENPPHSNVLLGGMVGTGKSNALKDLIYSAAVRYSPDEVEMVLLDFKAGIEFKVFDADASGTGWLPHVTVLGLESDQQYGVAVLRSVAEEIDRRSRVFRDVGGASSIVRYRETTGNPLARLLVIIDEFHVLLEGDDDLAQEAADLLELVAKQGRAFGVHLLLASQALSGISGLRTKADAIFAQFPVRVSLKNSATESQLFLSQGNTAAADLRYRGEVVLNRNLGQQPSTDNVRGLAAFVDQQRWSAVQREMWATAPGRRPRVFVGGDHAPWDVARLDALTHVPGALDLWLGRQVAVDDTPATVRLRPDTDQLVAIVGADQGRHRVVPGLLGSIVVSAASQLAPGSEIVVLDASGDDVLTHLAPALQEAERRGNRTRVVPAHDVAQYLRDECGPRLDEDPEADRLVLALGVQRIPGLDDTPPPPAAPAAGDFDLNPFGGGLDPLGTGPRTARAVLTDVARTGALHRTYLVGWWSGVSALEQTVGLSHNGVAAYLTAGAGLEDLRRIGGPLTKRLSGSPRVGFVDRASDRPLQPIVPFAQYDGGTTA